MGDSKPKLESSELVLARELDLNSVEESPVWAGEGGKMEDCLDKQY